MAVAFVKAGSVAIAAAATVSPTFGQNTTAGNCLIGCVVAVGSSASPTTTGTGWTVVTQPSVSDPNPSIFVRLNCGATEAAPTFTSTGATAMQAVLAEFSGVALAQAVDQKTSSTSAGNFGVSGTILNPAPNGDHISTSDVAIFLAAMIGSKSTTATFSDSFFPSGGSGATIGDTSATKGTLWIHATYYLLSGNGSQNIDSDSVAWTVASGVQNTVGTAVASFAPPYPIPRPIIVSQAVARSAFW